jgi:hypothetical protein
MRCSACGDINSQGDRFCGSCGSALAVACNHCGATLSVNDRFCGGCGSPVSSGELNDSREGNADLFPLYGVTLGKTTVEELARLGTRSTSIDKNTGAPYRYYVIRGTNFWYDDSEIAGHIYIARGIYSIPDPWKNLGFDWDISYDQWLQLLQGLGYSITLEGPPRIVKYEGHDCFSAKILATKPAGPLISLDFNYNNGSKADSKATLYSISVKAS